MLKSVLKFLGGAAGIVVLGMGALLGVQYWRYQTSPEYRTIQNLKNLEKQYAEDPYGGDTPEETLRLFIDALKNGDTELAAKYFILDKQQQWREDLAKIKEKGLLDKMINELLQTKKRVNGDRAFFTLIRDNDIPSELIMYKNLLNGIWKISEL